MDMIRYDGNKFRPKSDLRWVVRKNNGAAELYFACGQNDSWDKVLVNLSDVEIIPMERVLDIDADVVAKPLKVAYLVTVSGLTWDHRFAMEDEKTLPKHLTDTPLLLSDPNDIRGIGDAIEEEFSKGAATIASMKVERVVRQYNV